MKWHSTTSGTQGDHARDFLPRAPFIAQGLWTIRLPRTPGLKSPDFASMILLSLRHPSSTFVSLVCFCDSEDPIRSIVALLIRSLSATPLRIIADNCASSRIIADNRGYFFIPSASCGSRSTLLTLPTLPTSLDRTAAMWGWGTSCSALIASKSLIVRSLHILSGQVLKWICQVFELPPCHA